MFIQGLCFALCFFAFQLTEFTVNDRTGSLLGVNAVNTVYSVGIACTALGFLSFSLLRRLFAGERARKILLCAVGLSAILSSGLLLFTGNHIVFIVSSFLALLCFGNIGGCVYYNNAMTFAGSACTGRVLGLGMGGAVLLQFIVQNLLVTGISFLVSVAASVAVLVYFVINPPRDWMFENPLPYSAEDKTDGKKACSLLAAVILMSLVVGLIDGVVVAKHAGGQMSVSSYARLFYAGSLIVSGFVADIKNRKHLPLVTVCMMFLSTISTVFMGSAATFFFGTAFMYLYCGFYVMFLTVSFLDFAPKTKNPALWAGMGRVARGLATALTAVPVVKLFEALGSTALVAGSCGLSIVVLLVMLKDIGAAVAPVRDVPPEPVKAALSKEEAIPIYEAHYSFTPREAEVFEKLMLTEDGVQEMADGLFISRRVLQRYIAAIYEKTGTKSRIGLHQSFTDFMMKP